jgi:hypothetical protein
MAGTHDPVGIRRVGATASKAVSQALIAGSAEFPPRRGRSHVVAGVSVLTFRVWRRRSFPTETLTRTERMAAKKKARRKKKATKKKAKK